MHDYQLIKKILIKQIFKQHWEWTGLFFLKKLIAQGTHRIESDICKFSKELGYISNKCCYIFL